MKRDMNLIRQILEYVEEQTTNENFIRIDAPDLPGYDQNKIDYHVELCNDAGFIRTASNSRELIRGLTWQGQDELESMRQEK